MTFGMRAAVILAVFVTALLLAACGGSDASSEMRLTLTDEDCTYEGDETLAAGAFTVEVEEATAVLGLLAMLDGRRAKPAAQALAGLLDSRTLLPAAEVLVRWATGLPSTYFRAK